MAQSGRSNNFRSTQKRGHGNGRECNSETLDMLKCSQAKLFGAPFRIADMHCILLGRRRANEV